VHRLTQKTDVIVYKITVRDSVEERILALQEKKRELANQAIEGGKNGGLGKLGMNEILGLFRREAEHTHHVEIQRPGGAAAPTRPSVLKDVSKAAKTALTAPASKARKGSADTTSSWSSRQSSDGDESSFAGQGGTPRSRGPHDTAGRQEEPVIVDSSPPPAPAMKSKDIRRATRREDEVYGRRW
jgi:hypothetical protein